MSYKGKPLIVAPRPFWALWRRPELPWGWYSLTTDRLEGDEFEADGHFEPDDGGCGGWRLARDSTAEPNGGTIIAPDASGSGRYLRVWSFDGGGDYRAEYVFRDGAWHKLGGYADAPDTIHPKSGGG